MTVQVFLQRVETPISLKTASILQLKEGDRASTSDTIFQSALDTNCHSVTGKPTFPIMDGLLRLMRLHLRTQDMIMFQITLLQVEQIYLPLLKLLYPEL